MMYKGICLDGPRGGSYVTHMHDVMEVPIRPVLPPSYAGESVVAMSALRVERFRYHAVQMVAGVDTLQYWIPEEWYLKGQSTYTGMILKFLTEQYASST